MAGKKIATVDLDATIIESWKKAARRTDEGTSGYPPRRLGRRARRAPA
jgi:hypothetical protein